MFTDSVVLDRAYLYDYIPEFKLAVQADGIGGDSGGILSKKFVSG